MAQWETVLATVPDNLALMHMVKRMAPTCFPLTSCAGSCSSSKQALMLVHVLNNCSKNHLKGVTENNVANSFRC